MIKSNNLKIVLNRLNFVIQRQHNISHFIYTELYMQALCYTVCAWLQRVNFSPPGFAIKQPTLKISHQSLNSNGKYTSNMANQPDMSDELKELERKVNECDYVRFTVADLHGASRGKTVSSRNAHQFLEKGFPMYSGE